MTGTDQDVLLTSLQVAVPMQILKLGLADPETLPAIARECADVVAAHGDDILYRSARRGDTAVAFNALAKGLAVLAFSPGGVEFAGLRFRAGWEAVEARDVLGLRRSVFAITPSEDQEQG